MKGKVPRKRQSQAKLKSTPTRNLEPSVQTPMRNPSCPAFLPSRPTFAKVQVIFTAAAAAAAVAPASTFPVPLFSSIAR